MAKEGGARGTLTMWAHFLIPPTKCFFFVVQSFRLLPFLVNLRFVLDTLELKLYVNIFKIEILKMDQNQVILLTLNGLCGHNLYTIFWGKIEPRYVRKERFSKLSFPQG